MNTKGEKAVNQVFLEDSPKDTKNGATSIALKLKPNLKGLSSDAAAARSMLPLSIPSRKERIFK